MTDRPTKQPILNPAGAELSGRGRRAIILALTACLVMAGFVMACLVAVVLSAPARAQEQVAVPAGPVVVLDVRGAIGPATTGYLRDGFRAAAERDAALIVLRIDTPGGLASSMRDIIRDIVASPVPIVAYVAPGGARAASAGTYILYASHLAAMAPGTNLGAATPVQLGGGRQPLGGDGEDDAPREEPGTERPGNEEDDGPEPADAAGAKAVNDAVAYIRSFAELRDRNADWAEAAVRRAESLSAEAALERQVIEIVAADLDALLAQADGREIAAVAGRTVTLHTEGRDTVEIAPDWRARLLGIITDPNIAYILMLIGIYGIIFELVSPGAVVPGVVGAIALIVGLFALNMLPVDYAGAGLVLLGVALMTAEAFVPSFGVLGIGGAIAFFIGSLFLFEEVPGFTLSLPVVLTAAAMSVALLAVMLAAVVRAHRRRVTTGESALIGALGEVVAWSGGQGLVHVDGERWQARSAAALAQGEAVRVTGRNALTLTVEPDRQQPPPARPPV